MTALPDYDSPLALKSFLDSRGMAMQKKFGQNFMVNRASRERLVDALDLAPGARVWEIGPGLGSMTDEILKRGANLAAFEIDRGFCAVLGEIFADRPNFSLIPGDVLKNWLPAVERLGVPDCLFGNLPYNIAAAIIGDMISDGIRFNTVVITVQKEVALRMAAKPGTEDYSSFSVLCQWAYKVSPLMDLAGGCFWPRPNVTSKAIKMTKKDDWPSCQSPAIFMSILRGLFSSRRKTIKNNLSAWLAASGRVLAGAEADALTRDILALAGLDPSLRAENLDLGNFLKLADVVAGV
jgi:16S rRNA (adenine1518-N6/adenine1519-N6)-dimethyltransferase